MAKPAEGIFSTALAEETLSKEKAFLVFKCAECGKMVIVKGYKRVHDATASQLAAETQQLFCDACIRG